MSTIDDVKVMQTNKNQGKVNKILLPWQRYGEFAEDIRCRINNARTTSFSLGKIWKSLSFILRHKESAIYKRKVIYICCYLLL